MTQEIERHFSGAPWEQKVGYCRAVRVGNRVVVSGTASVNPDGSVHGQGDGYAQARRCLEIIADSLTHYGPATVIRTRMFVTDIGRWEQFGRAHAEAFGENPPVTSMVEIHRLIHPDMLIEIEAEAVLEEE